MAYQLGILGAGNMAEAIVRGLLRSGRMNGEDIIAADVSAARRQLFTNELEVKTVESNDEVARQSNVVLLSVKPQQMQAALEPIGAVMNAKTLVLSIAAGISTTFIESALGQGNAWRVVRSMPNTPMLVGEGMVAIAAGKNATGEDLDTARHLFEAAASVIEVDEDKIDAVTAVSGSGPAYFFYLAEQMIRAGTEMGLTAEQARMLASKTALGAAKMLLSSTDSPAELRRKVTSPGGTTEAAILHMESRGMQNIVMEAVLAAQQKSRQLGK